MKEQNWEERSGLNGAQEEIESTRPFDVAELRKRIKEDFEKDHEDSLVKNNGVKKSSVDVDYDQDALRLQLRSRLIKEAEVDRKRREIEKKEQDRIEKERIEEEKRIAQEEKLRQERERLEEENRAKECLEQLKRMEEENLKSKTHGDDTEDLYSFDFDNDEKEEYIGSSDQEYEDGYEEDFDEIDLDNRESHDYKTEYFDKNREAQYNQKSGKIKKKGSFFKTLRDWVLPLVAAVALALVIRMFIGGATTVKGESMLPTLNNGDILMVSKIPTYNNNFKRSDIVILDSPDHPDELYVKRVIGLPGETVEIHDGKVFINGLLLVEHYVKDLPTEAYRDNVWVLREDQYFVMGDNRNPGASNDSRLFGPVSADRLEAVARFRIWPLTGIKSFY